MTTGEIKNPCCACGCGLEVRKPFNRWIIGHSSKRKLTDEQVKEIHKLLGKVSQYEIARRYGVSQACIAKFSWQDGYDDRSRINWNSADLVRQEYLNQKEERKQWRSGKKTLKTVQSLLRNRQKLQSAVLQQAQTSQTS